MWSRGGHNVICERSLYNQKKSRKENTIHMLCVSICVCGHLCVLCFCSEWKLLADWYCLSLISYIPCKVYTYIIVHFKYIFRMDCNFRMCNTYVLDKMYQQWKLLNSNAQETNKLVQVTYKFVFRKFNHMQLFYSWYLKNLRIMQKFSTNSRVMEFLLYQHTINIQFKLVSNMVNE